MDLFRKGIKPVTVPSGRNRALALFFAALLGDGSIPVDPHDFQLLFSVRLKPARRCPRGLDGPFGPDAAAIVAPASVAGGRSRARRRPLRLAPPVDEVARAA